MDTNLADLRKCLLDIIPPSKLKHGPTTQGTPLTSDESETPQTHESQPLKEPTAPITKKPEKVFCNRGRKLTAISVVDIQDFVIPPQIIVQKSERRSFRKTEEYIISPRTFRKKHGLTPPALRQPQPHHNM